MNLSFLKQSVTTVFCVYLDCMTLRPNVKTCPGFLNFVGGKIVVKVDEVPTHSSHEPKFKCKSVGKLYMVSYYITGFDFYKSYNKCLIK